MEKRMEEIKRIIETGGLKEAKNMMTMGINKEVMNYVSRERGEDGEDGEDGNEKSIDLTG